MRSLQAGVEGLEKSVCIRVYELSSSAVITPQMPPSVRGGSRRKVSTTRAARPPAAAPPVAAPPVAAPPAAPPAE